MMIKKILACCIIIALIIGGANTFGPNLAAEGLYQALSQKMELAPDDVNVMATPGGKVFLGNIDEVQVHANQFTVGKVQFESFDCILKNVQFDPIDTLVSQRLAITHADYGEMTASVKRDALRDFLVKKIDGLSNVTVDFQDNLIHVEGDLEVGGLFTAHANIDGTFGMNGTKLMFIPQNMTVEGLGIKYSSSSIGNAEIYDFQTFPLGMQPDKVTMDGDVLTIHGQIRNS